MLMMAAHDLFDRLGKMHRGHDLGADGGMRGDLLELLVGEPTRLGQDIVWNADLAYVVQYGRELKRADL